MDLSLQNENKSAASVLRAMADAAEQLDYQFDTYGSGKSLQAFETLVARMMGKESAAFFPTGTAAQQCALYAYGAQHVLVHPTSHLVHLDCLGDGPKQEKSFSEKASQNLPGFNVLAFGEMSRLPSCADVVAVLAAVSGPAVLVLELPQRMNGERPCEM